MRVSSNKNKIAYIYTSLGIVLIFAIWAIGSFLLDKEYVLPKVSTVFNTLVDLFKEGSTYRYILFTLIRIVISLVLGFLIGIFLGGLASRSERIYYLLSPMIKIMRALPIASIILIILIMFGNKGIGDINISPILVSLLLIIPLVFEATYQGIKNIDPALNDASRLYTNNTVDKFFRCDIPLIKKDLEISISQSIGLSFKSMIMAEYISQSRSSIGNALLMAKTNFEYDKVFAWTIILIILSIIFEFISKKISK